MARSLAPPCARTLVRLIAVTPFVVLLMSHPGKSVAEEARPGELQIDLNRPFVPGARFEFYEYRKPSALSGDPSARGVRQVGVANGVRYRFDRKAAGAFQGVWDERDLGPNEPDTTLRMFRKDPLSALEHTWGVFCKQDLKTDSKWCVVNRQDLSIRVYGKASNRLVDVKIGKDHYPGSNVMLRVDKGSPITDKEGGFYGQSAKSALKQLLRGTSVVTRYQEWPEKNYTERAMRLRGLPESVRFIEWVLDGQPGLPPKPTRKPDLQGLSQVSTTMLEGTISSAANELIQKHQEILRPGNVDRPLN